MFFCLTLKKSRGKPTTFFTLPEGECGNKRKTRNNKPHNVLGKRAKKGNFFFFCLARNLWITLDASKPLPHDEPNFFYHQDISLFLLIFLYVRSLLSLFFALLRNTQKPPLPLPPTRLFNFSIFSGNHPPPPPHSPSFFSISNIMGGEEAGAGVISME